jgi:DNA-directed RNA polymerase specialized sigma24 family protein
MTLMVTDDQEKVSRLAAIAASLPRFDRLVLQLRWAEGLSRHETALSLDVQPASVLAAEMRLRAWVQGERDALS